MTALEDPSSKYCIIGAGAAGLTTCRALLQHGIPFDCFERAEEVGGIFNYGAANSSVYNSTHLLSSKPTTEFPDFPMPADYPPCPRHHLVLDYFRSYAQHFGLYEKIQFNTGVESVAAAPNGWNIRLSNGQRRVYRGIAIANGHHWDPVMPNLPGEFSGPIYHSKQYKTPDLFAGKRVLVIGAGNSACDIAADAVSMASRVFLSMRSPVHFLSKYSFGNPGDVTIQAMIRWGVPLSILRILAKLGAWVINGNPRTLGMPTPDHRIFDSSVTLSSLVPFHIRQGDIKVKTGVDSLHGSSVRFADGTVERIDMIVCATGFKVSFPFIDTKELNLVGGRPQLFLHQFHPDRDDLSVVGLFQSATGGHWRLMHYQAQLLARYLTARTRREDLRWFDRIRSLPPEDLKHGFAIKDLDRHHHTVEPVRFENRLQELIHEFDRRGRKSTPARPSTTKSFGIRRVA